MLEAPQFISTNSESPETGFMAEVDLHKSTLDSPEVGRARADALTAINHEQFEVPKHRQIAQVGLRLAQLRADEAAAANSQPKHDDFELVA